ncbi:hypothetical protein [Amycolatopsis kentuckyensis]|uniref:hypothetical protein n=1 Tax=Amycolatopsis kentuckyensis TaxID=218823 RepID=UPI0035647CC3
MTTRIDFPAEGQSRKIRATAWRRLRHIGFRRTWWRGPIRHQANRITLVITREYAHVDFPDQVAHTEASRLAALKYLDGYAVPEIVRDVVNAVSLQESRKRAGLPPR